MGNHTTRLALTLSLALAAQTLCNCSDSAGGMDAGIDANIDTGSGSDTDCPSPLMCVHKDECSSNGGTPHEELFCGGNSVCCFDLPSTDYDAGCHSGNGALDWEPLPEGLDCGPGCRQLSFEPVNSVTEWSATHRYVAYSNYDTGDLYVVDVDQSQRARIGDSFSGYYRSPDIKGNDCFVLFDRRSSDFRSVVHFDLSAGTGQCCLKETAAKTGFGSLAVTGNDIAFIVHKEDAEHGRMDLLTLCEDRKTVYDESHVLFDVRAEGDYVVWDDNWTDVWAYQISNGKVWNLTDYPADQFLPRMAGSRVVWTDLRNGPDPNVDGSLAHADIYMYDFASGKTTEITNAPWIHYRPDVSGDRIVWEDYRAGADPNNAYDFGCVDIWMYDLKTKTEHQITSYPGGESDAQIDGDRVYYYRYSQGIEGIFVQELSALGL
jgi:beta propeller repeat protein